MKGDPYKWLTTKWSGDGWWVNEYYVCPYGADCPAGKNENYFISDKSDFE